MNYAEFENLSLRARIAYAVMCFERYVRYVYSGVDFKPAAEFLWQITDGSSPMEEAAQKAMEIVPERLFACKTYAEYQAAGHEALTQEQYRALTRALNPHDRNLNSMMKLICEMADIQHPADTLPILANIAAMLEVRSVALPELSLLRAYTFSGEDWQGDPVDPAPLSLLGIERKFVFHSAVPAEPVVHNEDAGPNLCRLTDPGFDGYERSFAFDKFDEGDLEVYFAEPSKPVIEANGCKWEILESAEGCTILRCINLSFRKEVTIPETLNEQPVIAINAHAFDDNPQFGCQAIEVLDMPDTIRTIGDCFFRGCANLRQIHMSAALETLGHEAFRGASRLERLDIGDNCRVIGDYFCADGLALREVTIGTGIEYIGEYTFYNTPVMTSFRCAGMLKELGYGSFWVNKWADSILFNPITELLRFCKDDALLYRYVKRMPPPRLFFDEGIKYVYDFAFGGDAWHSGDGITDIFFPGAEKIGVQAFRKTPNATVHLSASRMEAAYGQDYVYTLEKLCEPAKVVFDQP